MKKTIGIKEKYMSPQQNGARNFHKAISSDPRKFLLKNHGPWRTNTAVTFLVIMQSLACLRRIQAKCYNISSQKKGSHPLSSQWSFHRNSFTPVLLCLKSENQPKPSPSTTNKWIRLANTSLSHLLCSFSPSSTLLQACPDKTFLSLLLPSCLLLGLNCQFFSKCQDLPHWVFFLSGNKGHSKLQNSPQQKCFLNPFLQVWSLLLYVILQAHIDTSPQHLRLQQKSLQCVQTPPSLWSTAFHGL